MRLTAPFLALAMALAVAACGQSDPAPTPAKAPAAAPAPEMPVDAPPQEEVGPDEGVDGVLPQASDASCLSDIGAQASARLVERCRAVSPATRPPCNAANPCALIQGEIDRSCGQYGPGEAKPAECAA